MSNFRLTYKRFRGAEPEAAIFSAGTVQEATAKLNESLKPFWVYTIERVSVQCSGTTAKGTPCQRFTSEERCPGHAKEAAAL